MKNYLLAHGFGFTNDYWQNLTPLLDGNIYFFDDPDLDKKNIYVGIGHSMGFLKLNNSGLKFEALVALQGFLNYCGSTVRMRRVREAELAKFRENVNLNKNECLRKFREFCGYTQDVLADIPLHLLQDELNMMENSYEHCGIRTLVIGSTDDVIVPMSIINDNFAHLQNVSITQLSNGQHALGYLYPELVAKKIYEFQ